MNREKDSVRGNAFTQGDKGKQKSDRATDRAFPRLKCREPRAGVPQHSRSRAHDARGGAGVRRRVVRLLVY